MRVRFIGDGDPDNAVCDVFDQSFPVGEWVEGDFPAKLLSNPLFEVDGSGPGVTEPPKRRGRAPRGDLS